MLYCETIFWSNCSDLRLYNTNGTLLSSPTGGTIYIVKFGPIIQVKVSGLAATTYSYRTYLRTKTGGHILSNTANESGKVVPVTETGSFLGNFFESSDEIMFEAGKTNGVWDTSICFVDALS